MARRGKDKRTRADRAAAKERRLQRQAEAARAAQGAQGAPSSPPPPPPSPSASAPLNPGAAAEGPVSVPPTTSSEPGGTAPAGGPSAAGAVPLPSDLKGPDDVARWLAMLFAFPAATVHRAWSLTGENGEPTPRAQAAAINLWPVIQKYGIGKGLTEYFPEMMALHAVSTLLRPVYEPTVRVIMGEEPSEIEIKVRDLARRAKEKKEREVADAQAAARAANGDAAGAVVEIRPRTSQPVAPDALAAARAEINGEGEQKAVTQ